MRSSIIAHLRVIDLPKPLRIMTNDRVEQKNLHKTTQLEVGEQTKKQREVFRFVSIRLMKLWILTAQMNLEMTLLNPGKALTIVALSTQKAILKYPGPANPVPGTVRMFSSCRADTNATSSSMGLRGKR